MTKQFNEIHGLDGVVKAFTEMGPALQGKKGFPQNMLRNAARKMANEAKETAKSKAPVETGRLRDAIKIKLLSAKYRDQATAQGDSKEYYYLGINAGWDRNDPKGAWYGDFVETGTDRMEAQPFLRPAVIGKETKLTRTFEDKFRGDVERTAKRLNQKYGYAQAKGRS